MKKIFGLALLAVFLALPLFATDSGAVTEKDQQWAGFKAMLAEKITDSTLVGNVTVDKSSTHTLRMDPGGSSRNVTLDTSCNTAGNRFFFINSADASENLVIKNSSGSTICTIGQNQAGYVWYSTGVTWYGYVLTNSASGFMAADGSVTGATGQTQVFTNGATLDTIVGNTATTLSVTAKAGSSAVGNPITVTGGAGNGAFAGGAASLTGGASGAGATGAGGAVAVTGGAAASTNGAGGAGSFIGGAGAGTGAGGAITITGGASGAGATGNGGALAATAGAALSTNGTGGAASLVGGVATGNGTGGALTLTSGASGGAGGTAGSIAIDTGSKAGGTDGSITIGGTNCAAMTIGRSGQVVTFPGTVSRASQRYCYGVGGAKVGGTAGFVINAASNTSAATVPQSQTGSILIVPIPYLKSGAVITGFGLCGQIESAGGAVTVDVDLRVQTAAAADFTDASVATMTQISVTADTKIDSTQDKGSLTQTVAQDEAYYLKITVTTAATTDVDIRGIRIIVTEK